MTVGRPDAYRCNVRAHSQVRDRNGEHGGIGGIDRARTGVDHRAADVEDSHHTERGVEILAEGECEFGGML